MSTATSVDWREVEAAAKTMAGNWKDFDSFAWHRAFDLDDADNWAIVYTSNRDSGLLAQSTETATNKFLEKYTDGDDPDLVFESHSHWAVGHIDGFSVRVYKEDGTITEAFTNLCGIKERLADYPVLDESDYSEREYAATLENYGSELWRLKDTLPEGWQSQVYSYFSDNGHERFIESADDQGGYAPREKIIEALQTLGLLPPEADESIIV
jgi:hypothetical protein